MGWQRRQALGRMRRAKGMAASGQYGIGAEMALRRQRAINTDSDSDEEEAVVGGSLRATLGAGHAEGAGGFNLTHNSDTEESMMTDETTAESEGRKRRRVAMASDSGGAHRRSHRGTARRRTETEDEGVGELLYKGAPTPPRGHPGPSAGASVPMDRL